MLINGKSRLDVVGALYYQGYDSIGCLVRAGRDADSLSAVNCVVPYAGYKCDPPTYRANMRALVAARVLLQSTLSRQRKVLPRSGNRAVLGRSAHA